MIAIIINILKNLSQCLGFKVNGNDYVSLHVGTLLVGYDIALQITRGKQITGLEYLVQTTTII